MIFMAEVIFMHHSSVDSPMIPTGVAVNGRDTQVPSSTVETKPLSLLAVLSDLSMK